MLTIKSAAMAVILALLSFQSYANTQLNAEDYDWTLGLGYGTMYSGIGANYGLRSDTDIKYVSLGYFGYSSTYGSKYGVGIGWINSDWIIPDSKHHAMSTFIGTAGVESSTEITSNGTYKSESKTIYGIGLGYQYFMNGINEPGFTIGFALVARDAEYDDKLVPAINIGYQF
ncbi:hypothetical protein [Thalassotalea sp. PS06]|uniref:hypothetical protein n=1 Tax=Thalassotalea sp. PS06 TaxID=2594005 RepID=UPI0011630866|nr:hypothetical protein [Thalassotalea sp. PS06]QDP00400.1 hypothetical protein FNC98_02955 [Thalassotalea sp. PS06]